MTSRKTFNSLYEDLNDLIRKHGELTTQHLLDTAAKRDIHGSSVERGLNVIKQIEDKIGELIAFADSDVSWESEEDYNKFRNSVTRILTELEASKITYQE